MRSPFHIAVLFFLCVAVPAFATTQIFRYTDDSGTLNFTTELGSIPEKYRSRVIPLEPDITPDVGALAAPQPVLRVVKSSGEYRMGDYDTRTDAIRMAMEIAKREALEQVATYLENVTEVKNLDVTRDEIQTYTAGVVMVLNQQTSTRIEDGTPVFHVDLTARVDQQEVIQAITAFRENESAKQELISLRAETDQLRQQLDAANQGLVTANTPEEVQALTQQRQQLLNHIQADALVSQAWTDWIYVTPIIYPYPAIGVRRSTGSCFRQGNFTRGTTICRLSSKSLRRRPVPCLRRPLVGRHCCRRMARSSFPLRGANRIRDRYKVSRHPWPHRCRNRRLPYRSHARHSQHHSLYRPSQHHYFHRRFIKPILRTSDSRTLRCPACHSLHTLEAVTAGDLRTANFDSVTHLPLRADEAIRSALLPDTRSCSFPIL